MQNAGLDDSQAGIKISGRNISNLRYADDITLMAESKEGLKSLLMKVKEESEKTGLKLDIKKTKIMASSPITSWQIDGAYLLLHRYHRSFRFPYCCLHLRHVGGSIAMQQILGLPYGFRLPLLLPIYKRHQ